MAPRREWLGPAVELNGRDYATCGSPLRQVSLYAASPPRSTSPAQAVPGSGAAAISAVDWERPSVAAAGSWLVGHWSVPGQRSPEVSVPLRRWLIPSIRRAS